MSSGLHAVSAAAMRPARRRHEPGARRVGDGDHQHAGYRRQGAQAGLAVAPHPRPHPRHAVVQRRSGLALRDEARASCPARTARAARCWPRRTRTPGGRSRRSAGPPRRPPARPARQHRRGERVAGSAPTARRPPLRGLRRPWCVSEPTLTAASVNEPVRAENGSRLRRRGCLTRSQPASASRADRGSRHYLQRMREDSGSSDPPVALASSAGDARRLRDASVALPRVALRRASAAGRAPLGVTLGPVAGRIAVGTLIAATFAIVAAASAGPVDPRPALRPDLPQLGGGAAAHGHPTPDHRSQTVGLVFSGVLVVMLVAYAAALAAVRTPVAAHDRASPCVALHLILLLSPPMQLTDLFNYLGYARLGALHHLNPYTHVDPPGAVRPRLRLLELAQPAQPLRPAVHRAHLSARAGVAAASPTGR